MLFATEGFESFNAVIRSHSIHSNHQAPSRDIATGMAHHNRVRQFLSGGYFHMPRVVNGEEDEELDSPSPRSAAGATCALQSPWLRRVQAMQRNYQKGVNDIRWRCASSEPLALLALNHFDQKILGMFNFNSLKSERGDIGAWLISCAVSITFQCTVLIISRTYLAGLCRKLSDTRRWGSTLSGQFGLAVPPPLTAFRRFRVAEEFQLRDGEWCQCTGHSWVIWHARGTPHHPGQPSPILSMVGRILEAVQAVGSDNEPLGKVDLVLIQNCTVQGRHPSYDMPQVVLQPHYTLVSPSVSHIKSARLSMYLTR